MNATQNTTTTASSVPSTPTVHKLTAPARIAVNLPHYRGGRSAYSDSFTFGSVAEYAARYHEDVDAAVERSTRLGHDLYYAFNEGVMLTAHPQEVIERTEVALGDIIEADGKQFTVVPANNRNIKLVPLATV